MSLRNRRPAWLILLAAAALSCSSDNLVLPSEGLPAAMAVVGGTAQTATVATPLPDSILVRVTDSESRPVEGIKVVFTPVLGGGDAVPDTGVTNADGRTGTRWILGSTAGAQRLMAMVVGATASGALTQNFDATAVAAAADTIFVARGNNQSAEVGAALTDSLVVRVNDQYGNPVSGTVVAWAPTGGGSVSPGSSTTSLTGIGATQRILGATAGAQGATATAAGLKGSPVTFAMTALPAAPTSLVKVSGDNQSGAVSGPLTDSLVVRLLDGTGNGVPGRNVTFAVATGGGTTAPTSATTDSNGRAATRWTLGPSAGSNSLIASSSGFSVTFLATANSAAATTLLANSPLTQNGTAGLPAGSSPSVRVTDANGNSVAGVAITFAVTLGGGSILPVTPVATNASGVATLSQWVLGTAAGNNAVTASAAGLTPSQLTFTATGAAGTAAQLQVQTQPSPSAQSGVALATQPTVRLADVFGNPVGASGVQVTASLASGSGTLGGTLSVLTVGGLASFTNLAVTGPSGTYTIGFASGSLTPDTSAVIAIGAGVATRLAITTQPSTTSQNGVAFAQQPRAQVQDAAGNPVAGVRSVTVAINSGGGVLGGTATLNTDAAGLATFAGLSITGTAGARTLVLSSPGLTSIVSNTVTITAGTPTQMAVNAGNNQTATAGSAVAIAPSVVVRDISNNPVANVAVTFAVAGGGGSVLPVTAVNTNASGIAAATSWTLGSTAGANALTATAAPAGITPNPVNFSATSVAGGAGGIGMITQPSASVVNGAVISQAPVVQVLDVNGNPVATPTSVAITVGIASGPGGTLAGLTTVGTNASGQATFNGLSITGLAGAYTLQFTSPTLTGVGSAPVTVSAGAATQVKITVEPPTGAQSGIAMAPPTVVQLQDVSGNAVSANGVNIVAALVSGGGTLTGTLTVATVAGGASTFSNLILTGTAGPRVIRFTSTGLTPDTATTIALTAGAPTALEFVVQPSAVTAGQAIAPAITVRVRDGAGNTVSTATNAVTMAIGANPGGSTLGGTLGVNAVAGVASFGTLSLNRAGLGYTLGASAAGLTSATSTGFTVTAAGASTIAANSVTSQTDTAGLPVGAPPSVLVTDANTNPVAGVSVTFTVTGGGGSRLPATAVVTNASGVAVLTSWTLGSAAGANTLTATAAGLTGSPVTFNATGVAGTATQLQVATQPSSSAQSGVALVVQPAVRLADAFGNPVSTGGTIITAALGSGSGTLGGTLTATTVGGVATFTNLAITGPTGAYTLQFTSPGLTLANSNTVAIGAGVITQLAMVTQPSASAVNGVALAVQPAVQLRDGANNPVLQAGTIVTAVLQGGGVLGGTVTATTNASGVATFTNLSITGLVGARTLQFTSGSLTPAVSGTVTLSAGAATQIAINAGNAQTAMVNTAVATPPSVLVRDASNNPVAGVPVTFAVASGGGSVLPVTAVITNAAGIAALGSWTLGTIAGANSVSATSAGLTGSPLTITATGTAGAATQLQVATQPSAAAQSGVAFPAQPAIRLADAFGNLVNTTGTVVTAAIFSGTGTLGGTLTASTAAGVATFTNLALSGPAGAFTLRFTSGALAAVNSNSITLSAGTATQLVMVTQPSATAQSGVVFAQQPAVQVQDAAGNPVAGVVSVTATIATGSAALGGTTTVSTNAAGLATFTTLAITGAVGARTLAFSSGGLTPDTSTAVAITAGAATQIAINAGNAQSAIVNTTVAIAPSVIVRDASNNPVAGVAVSFAVTGGGGSIVPVAPAVTNASGVAALTSWTLGTIVGANSLSATAAGLTGSPLSFTATGTAGAATQLQMVTQPSAAALSGAAFTTQPAVRLADAFGNPVATNAIGITAAINTGTGTLGGTLTVNTVAGVTTFTNLALSGAAGVFTLRFSSGALTLVTSTPITLSAGAATQLVMVAQPSASAQNAIALVQQPSVQVQDAAGNPVAGVRSVTATILTGGGALGGTATLNTDAAGLATFTNLAITGTVGARTLNFASTGLTSAVSSAVTLTAGLPTQMAVSAGNGQTATAGTAVAVDPAVLVRDVSNNPVAGVNVTFAVALGAGSVQPVTPVVTNASGVAAATSWTLGTVAGANSLAATAAPGGIAGNPITFTATAVAGSAGQLAIITQPPTTRASGVTLVPAPVIQLQDSLGNDLTTLNFPISVAIASGPGGILSGSNIALTNASGRATFGALTITGPTGDYTLQFTGAGVTGVTSSTVTLTAGAAAQVSVASQPTTAQSGIAFAPTVQVQDAAGNAVGGVRNITVGPNSGTAVLSGTLTRATNGTGLATFTGLVLTGPIGPNTLLFSSAGLTSDTTAVIALTAGNASQLTMVQQPSATAASGVAFAQQPTVQVRDASGNPVSTVVSVTAAIASGGGTLGGTVTVSTDAAGLATFTNLSVTGTVGARTLQFTSAGLTTATSSGVTISAGAATQLTMGTQPSATAASGASFAQQPTVQLRDASGNAVSSVVSVTVTILTGGGALGGVATINTSGSGLATFTGLSITGTVGARTLQFASAGLTPATSTAVTISAGAPTQMTINAGDGQSATVNTAVATAPAVLIRDASNNPVAGVAVTFAVASGGGAVLPVAAATTNAAGIATATSWTLGTAAGANSLTATAGPVGVIPNPVTFNATATAGAAAQVVMVQQPSAAVTNGAALAQQPTVQIQDALGNPVSAVVSVTASIASGGGALGGLATVSTNGAGLATFSGLSITGIIGARTLQFSSGALTPAVSSAITVSAGTATQLTMVQQPSATAASGAAFAQQPTVQVRDVSGNPVSMVASVTVAIASGGGALGGIATINTSAAGLASFAGLSIAGTVGARTLQFTSGALTPATSSGINITAGAPTQMTLSAGDGQAATANSTVAIAPAVLVRDASNNPVSGVSVTFAVATGGGSVLPAAAVATNAAGIATATSWTLGTAAGPNSLTATAAPGGITPNPVTFAATATAGAASQLTMVQQPSASAVNGAVLALQPTVQLRDALGNPVSSVVSVTVSIATGGGALGGLTTVSTNATGLATFSGLTITGTIGARTLQFTSGALTAATSSAINITAGTATQLTMVQQPSASVTNGAVLAQQPTVQVRDASGNPVSGVVSVTAAIATGGGALGGLATTSTDGAGLASFTGLSITGTVGARTLQFTSGALTLATSTAVNLTAGAATQLTMVQQPSATAASGAAFAQQPTVQLRDVSGNAVSSVVSVTATILSGGGTLGGTATISTSAGGLATYTGLSVAGTIGSRTLQFSSTGVTSATSSAIAITPGVATQLAIVQQPSASAANGAAFVLQPTVQVLDASGNAVSTVVSVTAAILTGGGTLGGTPTVSTSAGGLATFAGLSITGTVGARTLQFTSGALTPVSSTGVTITAGAPTQMTVSAGDAQSAIAGSPVATPPAVLLRDASNNPVSGILVTFAAATGGGTALPGAAVATNASGIATASSWTLGTVAGPNTLTATAAPVGITPNPVTFTATGTPGVATALAITTGPTSGQSGLAVTPQPVLRLVDLNGNTVTTTGTLITATLASGTGTLAGATASTVNGVATFTGLGVTGLAGSYTLRFDAPSLAGVTGLAFPLSAGTPTALAFSVQPITSAAGASIPTPQVEVRDGAGNRVTTATTSITVAIGSNPGGSALTGTVNVSAVAGLASFPGLSLNRTGTGYTLTATGGALAQATSAAFNVTPGAPAAVAFVGQPSTVVAGASIAPAVTVEILDAAGNRVTTSAASVTVAIGTNPNTGALSGTATLSAAAGLATFSNLSVNRNGAGYTLTAASGGLTGAVSTAFNVDPGVAAALAITTAPTTGTNGVALAPQPVIRLVDALGNTVPTNGTTITAALASGAGTLGGLPTANTVSGVATFTNLALTGTAGPYTINFSSAPLTSVTSGTITLGAGAANSIASNSVTLQTDTVGLPVAAPPSVLVTDVGGNPVAGVAVTFAVTGGGGSVAPLTPVLTNASGIATATSWTLGSLIGANTLTASAAVPTGSPVLFSATGVAGVPTTIAALSVTTQSATVGTPVGAPPSVRVTDAGTNPVAGVNVTFAVTAGGGTLGVPVVVATNASGIATATSWTLGTGAGTNNNTVTAMGAGTLGGNPVLFTASGTAGAATQIAANSATSQSDTVGLPAAAPPSVIVRDAGNNPVAGVAVTFGVTGGGGAVLPGTPVLTNASGIATATSWTLGNTAGTNNNTATATAAGLTGSPVLFTASGVAGVPTALAFGTQPTGTTVGGTIAPPVTVRLQDAFGNLTTSTAIVGLAIGANPGSATLDGTVSRAAVGGVATFNDLTLDAAGVGYTLNASSVGLATIPSAAFTIGVASTTTTIVSDTPDPSVTGQSVTATFTVTSAGGTPTGNVTVSDGAGTSCVATAAVGNCALVFPTAGARTLTATYAGDANFAGSVSTGAPHGVNLASTATTLTAHTPNPSTRGAAVNVTWSVAVTAPGAGTPTGSVTVGDGVNNCIAAVGAGGCSLVLNTVGARSLTATYSGDANFATSASPGAAHTVTPAATISTVIADAPDPSVVGQPVAVDFTVTGPAGTPTGSVTISDGLGASCVATVAVGTCTVTFTTAGARNLTASYAGDANYLPSLSANAPHTVSSASTTTTLLTHDPDPSTTIEAVSVTWTVVANAPGAGTPTGNVTVSDGVDSCTADATAGGCTIPALTTSGTRTLTATYVGSANFLGSASAGSSHIVN